MELSREDVEEILALLREADVAYFELSTPDFRVVADNRTSADIAALGAAPAPAVHAPAAAGSASSHAGPQAVAAAPSAAAAPAARAPVDTPVDAEPTSSSAAAADTHTVTAPMVGVFYRCPEPGAPPFVDVGQSINKGDTIGLIEVMKTFTGVISDVDGVVVEFVADDAAFVEFGEVLVRVDTAG